MFELQYPWAAGSPAAPKRVMFDQRWCDIVFLHWPVEPGSVERLMPPGARVDVWEDGLTYVGLVPFRMRGAGIGRDRPVPWLGSFLEWNVRLYSVDDRGRHGVVFRSLDATRLPVVLAARFGNVPYRWARIRTESAGDVVRWRMRRWLRPSVTSSLELRLGGEIEPTPLERFLTARWGMHGSVAGRPVWVPNTHESWPLRAAELTAISDDLVEVAGVTPCGPMLRPVWSPGVHAMFSPPQWG